MKIGITSSVTARCFSLEEGFEVIAKSGFDCVDFPLNIYSIASKPEGNIHRSMYSDDWKSFVKRVVKGLSDNGLEAYQGHALWGLYTDLQSYIPPEKQYFRQLEAAAMIGIRHLVFHPIPPSVKMNDPSDTKRVMDYNLKWFGELTETAENFGVNIALENTFSHMRNVPGDGLFPFVTAESMLELAEGLNSGNVSVCLDTGHANVEHGAKTPEIVGKLGKRLKVLHVHDNFGIREPFAYSDLHMFPGFGTEKIEEISAELGRHGFDGVFSLEPSHANMPAGRLKIILKAAAELARYYSDIVVENYPEDPDFEKLPLT
ncbi:MAG: sugar phosphate isomerase/epimerase [Clostridia bacterium]|nr:sugar phosphate isomerase/epimerase [Clostridia bacterium]